VKLIQVHKPGPPGVMQLLDVAVPEPKPGEVLIRAHAIGVGELIVRLGVEGFAFLEGFPESGVAHDDRVNDAEFVEGELVLAQDADFLGTRDGAVGRILFAGQDLHERGFAGAVGAGDGIAAARHEGGGDVLKQDAGAEAHSDILNRDHNPIILP